MARLESPAPPPVCEAALPINLECAHPLETALIRQHQWMILESVALVEAERELNSHEQRALDIWGTCVQMLGAEVAGAQLASPVIDGIHSAQEWLLAHRGTVAHIETRVRQKRATIKQLGDLGRGMKPTDWLSVNEMIVYQTGCRVKKILRAEQFNAMLK